MEVRPGGVAGVADAAEHVARRQPLAVDHEDAREVGVIRRDAAMVREDDQLPEAVVPAGEDDASGARGADSGSLRSVEVDSLVETVAARAERADDRAFHRPPEPDGA